MMTTLAQRPHQDSGRHGSILFHPLIPTQAGEVLTWGRLYGSSLALALANMARSYPGLVVAIMPDTPSASRLEYELRFFTAGMEHLAILSMPSWETLPYDVFSPHQDIISQRLASLHRLPELRNGILVLTLSTLLHRLPPRDYLEANALSLDVGARLDMSEFRQRLESRGYCCVSQVMEHGEFAVRGGLVDLFPMGSDLPLRVDLFDDEIESIRSFDPESQRSLHKLERIRLLPAREFPLTEQSITRFRQGFRTHFEGDPQRSQVYREVTKGIAPAGIEYYLPLFFQQTHTLFDYLPANSALITDTDLEHSAQIFWNELEQRYEQRRHDIERPLLPPAQLFIPNPELSQCLASQPRIHTQVMESSEDTAAFNFPTRPPPALIINAKAPQPLAALKGFLQEFSGKALLVAETAGRRETILELLKGSDLYPHQCDSWQAFVDSDSNLGITVAPLDRGIYLTQPPLIVITETQLFGEHAMQRRRRKRHDRDTDAIVRNLAELHLGSPVVHEEHGVGRYCGLQTLTTGGVETEFLTLEYAGGDRLYVPVSSLHLISRYTGAAAEQAPLHKLGSEQWQRARKRATEKVRDVAVELLEIYARRAARQGIAYPQPDDHYAAFASAFPFEETPDQLNAINEVIEDMVAKKPMDRLVCGDVGFGKTEVAMRAAFIAVQGHRQVAVLVPTTLLAQQHFQTFCDRFADWPVRIEVISRFRSKKEQDTILAGLSNGNVDIVIGTHKLLQPGIKFKQLGLVVIDEEHRFGVRHKDRLKALRAEVDVLTLTATPIPRTLNMSLSELRELSIIATPPSRRLAIKTFISEWNDALIHEACLREIKRGGQVYFLHNEIETIDKMAKDIQALVPEAVIKIAHGQMSERELEQVMLDFYHQRFNLLLCTTIIESGIDIPSANTIVINRANRLGLAQLYQLRGRVGRSYHQAYAYLVVPPRRAMTADAIKRLEALESLEELGAGFTLATHDLEIRGAGELLGEEQSGQIHEIGFSLYSELLERAVSALKSGQHPDLDQAPEHDAEIELRIPALITEDYLPDIHARLVMYKRIASADSDEALRDLQVEMIDRFGLLPEASKNLFAVTALKLKARPLKVKKIEAGPQGGRIMLAPQPNIDPLKVIQLVQEHGQTYRFDGQHTLRFTMDLADTHARIQAVSELLTKLSP